MATLFIVKIDEKKHHHATVLVGQYLGIGKEGYALICGRSPSCAQVLVNGGGGEDVVQKNLVHL
jgi:hypothetical protein